MWQEEEIEKRDPHFDGWGKGGKEALCGKGTEPDLEWIQEWGRDLERQMGRKRN